MMDCAGVFCNFFLASIVVYRTKIFRWIEKYALKLGWFG